MLIFSHSFFVLHLSRFLFTDYNRLSSVGGETSMAEMIATLSDACEREFGFLATRLFRVFKNDETQGVFAEYAVWTLIIENKYIKKHIQCFEFVYYYVFD